MHEQQLLLVQFTTTITRKHHFHDQEAPLPRPGSTTSTLHCNEDPWCHYKRNLIDTLFNFGMCHSYNHLLQLTSNTANEVYQCLTMDVVVCPPKMCNGLFTTAAVATLPTTLVMHQKRIHFMALILHLCNILLISYAPAKDSFHSTGTSLMQHPSH